MCLLRSGEQAAHGVDKMSSPKWRLCASISAGDDSGLGDGAERLTPGGLDDLQKDIFTLPSRRQRKTGPSGGLPIAVYQRFEGANPGPAARCQRFAAHIRGCTTQKLSALSLYRACATHLAPKINQLELTARLGMKDPLTLGRYCAGNAQLDIGMSLEGELSLNSSRSTMRAKPALLKGASAQRDPPCGAT